MSINVVQVLSKPATAMKPPRWFPESVDRIPTCRADKSIPSLDSVVQSTDKVIFIITSKCKH